MTNSTTTILAIETSCDETGVAVVQLKDDKITVLAEAVASQIDIHATTGGVVPNVAAREHASIIQPMIREVLSKARITNAPPDKGGVGGVAVTVGPGLMPALSVGVTAAQTLAYAWDIPIIPIHHLEGHIYSALLTNYGQAFPALALIVSGGHTMLIRLSGHLQYEILGSTRDDAAGEAFDKVARMLGLPYPGGPAISELAKKGDSAAYDFTQPMLHSGDLDFSFSGLKTEVLYTLRKLNAPPSKGGLGGVRCDVAASFQQTVVDTLVAKTNQAIKQDSYKTLLLAGGVAANTSLRQHMKNLADQHDLPLRQTPSDLCGDNAVMIGQAAVFAHQAGRLKQWSDIDAQARVSIEAFNNNPLVTSY